MRRDLAGDPAGGGDQALLQHGRISDVGTHSELLARSDHYRYVIASLDDEEIAQLGRTPSVRHDDEEALA